LGVTDTPASRQLLEGAAVKGVADCEEIAAEKFNGLAKGPAAIDVHHQFAGTSGV
jgi:hypothetical protein